MKFNVEIKHVGMIKRVKQENRYDRNKSRKKQEEVGRKVAEKKKVQEE